MHSPYTDLYVIQKFINYKMPKPSLLILVFL
jgi:hypothetical protein